MSGGHGVFVWFQLGSWQCSELVWHLVIRLLNWNWGDPFPFSHEIQCVVWGVSQTFSMVAEFLKKEVVDLLPMVRFIYLPQLFVHVSKWWEEGIKMLFKKPIGRLGKAHGIDTVHAAGSFKCDKVSQKSDFCPTKVCLKGLRWICINVVQRLVTSGF